VSSRATCGRALDAKLGIDEGLQEVGARVHVVRRPEPEAEWNVHARHSTPRATPTVCSRLEAVEQVRLNLNVVDDYRNGIAVRSRPLVG
jgi:hypothetical protein